MLNRSTHTDQPLNPDHPLPTLLYLIDMDLTPHFLRPCVIPTLYRLRQLNELPHCIFFDQILIVEVIVEDFETLCCVADLGCESRRGAGLDPRHFCAEDLMDRLS